MSRTNSDVPRLASEFSRIQLHRLDQFANRIAVVKTGTGRPFQTVKNDTTA